MLLENVLEGMSEYFSTELSQKVKRGMALTAQKCEFTGAGVPLGYKIENKKYAVDPETAPIYKLGDTVARRTEKLKDENKILYIGIVKILRMWTHYEW